MKLINRKTCAFYPEGIYNQLILILFDVPPKEKIDYKIKNIIHNTLNSNYESHFISMVETIEKDLREKVFK